MARTMLTSCQSGVDSFEN